MTPADKIILTVMRGEGFYDVWTFSKDGGAAVAIRDVVTDEILFDGLLIGSMTLSSPFVYIQTERIDYIMPYLQDLVQHENERRIEWVESPLHIRFGNED